MNVSESGSGLSFLERHSLGRQTRSTQQSRRQRMEMMKSCGEEQAKQDYCRCRHNGSRKATVIAHYPERVTSPADQLTGIAQDRRVVRNALFEGHRVDRI